MHPQACMEVIKPPDFAISIIMWPGEGAYVLYMDFFMLYVGDWC